MMFGAWGTEDREESIRIIHRALDTGIDFIDTADVYSGGESEEIVGKALGGGRRDDDGPVSPARQKLAQRFDLSLPENQGKLEAVERLSDLADEAGITLIELAIAFVLRHPAIIGPRTMEHLESQLSAAEVVLPHDVLDRIDEIVAPATTINSADNGWVTPALEPTARRR
jgi:aryl-alcohol dehydrogenase-like predicted oxidoreductase